LAHRQTARAKTSVAADHVNMEDAHARDIPDVRDPRPPGPAPPSFPITF